MALNCISPGDFMVSIDLEDAYFSVPIFQPHRKYLRFLWNFKCYEFTCLPYLTLPVASTLGARLYPKGKQVNS